MSTLVGFAYAHIPHDEVDDIAISQAFSTDRTVFVAVRGVIFKSTDGGFTWNRQSRGLWCDWPTAVAISPAFSDDRTVFVGCRDGQLFRSTDAGHSWQKLDAITTNDKIAAIVISPNFRRDRTVLAMTSAGSVARSPDAGTTWTESFSGASALCWNGAVAILGTRDGGIHTSTNAGRDWKSYTPYPLSLPITSIAVGDGSDLSENFFVGTTQGIYELVSPGNTFRIVDAAPDSFITSLAISESGAADVLYASTWSDAVLRSVDNGKTWKKLSNGLITDEQADEYQQPHFSQVEVSADGILFLGSFCGVFRSDDHGSTWHKLETTLHHVIGLDVVPTVDSSYHLAIATYGGGAAASLDGGKTWRVDNRGFTNPRLGALSFASNRLGERVIFAAHYNRILRSDDGGLRWNEVVIRRPPSIAERVKSLIRRVLSRLRLRNSWLYALFEANREDYLYPEVFGVSPTFSEDGIVFAGIYPSGLVKSRDGGRTFSWIWETKGSRVWAVVVSPGYATDRTVFASLEDGIYRSLDAGASWSHLGSQVPIKQAALVISPNYVHDRTVFAGGVSGLYRSRNGGETWDKLDMGVGSTEEPVASLAISPNFEKDGQIIVQIRGGDLLRGYDGGDRFEITSRNHDEETYEFSHLIFEKESAPLIRFSPDFSEDHTVFAASVHRVFKSTDGGKSWMKLPQHPQRYEAETSLLRHFAYPISLKGNWVLKSGDDYSNGRVIYSSEIGSRVHFRFAGTGVRWIGARGQDRGTARVYIDGSFRNRVDQYGFDDTTEQILFSETGLSFGTHTLTIEVDSVKNENSSGLGVEVDAFEAIQGILTEHAKSYYADRN